MYRRARRGNIDRIKRVALSLELVGSNKHELHARREDAVVRVRLTQVVIIHIFQELLVRIEGLSTIEAMVRIRGVLDDRSLVKKHISYPHHTTRYHVVLSFLTSVPVILQEFNAYFMRISV